MAEKGSALLSSGSKITDLIKRPEINYWDVAALVPNTEDAASNSSKDTKIGEGIAASSGAGCTNFGLPEYVQDAVKEQVNIQIKYEGYISMQQTQAAAFKKMEDRPLPADIDYNTISGLRLEAQQKLSRLRPANLGQASRITGVSPADLSILLVYLKAGGR